MQIGIALDEGDNVAWEAHIDNSARRTPPVVAGVDRVAIAECHHNPMNGPS